MTELPPGLDWACRSRTVESSAQAPAASSSPSPQDHRSAERVPESTRRLLHVLATPGPVLGRHLDVLAWNPLAEALLGDPADRPPADRNMVSVLFREPEARMLCPGWENMARQRYGSGRPGTSTRRARWMRGRGAGWADRRCRSRPGS
ncbi:hypothetical protein [Streptomyces sp. NPDC090025]|uniref:MmyB family transcriptional regulator n=1 Tax=Streptomyces sp. NPDC090025 TaxID=3365922 RepID=UPI003832493B